MSNKTNRTIAVVGMVSTWVASFCFGWMVGLFKD